MSGEVNVSRGLQDPEEYRNIRHRNSEFYENNIRPDVENLLPTENGYEEPFFYTQEARTSGELSTALYNLAHRLGVDEKEANLIAGAAEIGAGNTLVIDDIVDNDEVRYGKKSAWKEFGLDEAILAAGMIQEDLHLMLSDLDSEAHRAFTEGFEKTYQSWFKEKQIKGTDISEVSAEELYEICKSKTAVGTGSLKALGLTADISSSKVDALNDYGEKKGIAWQLSNDLEEIAEGDKDDNHRDYSDFLNGYPTIPMLIGWRNMDNYEQEMFTENFPSDDREEAETAINLLQENDAYSDTIARGEELLEEAEEELSRLDDDVGDVLRNFSPILWP